MNLFLRYREQIYKLSYALGQELEQLLLTFTTAWRVEHGDDGRHGVVQADEVRVGFIPRSTGYVRLVTGTAVRPGYIDWRLADGTRTGYLGWDSTNVELGLENGAAFFITGGSVELPEMTDPDAPAANKARLYVRDNGAGKSQLCVRFATGAVQVIATEP